MKYKCEIIRDLIPLYIDDVASPSSRLMVEEHLEECPECRGEVERLKNDEIAQVIAEEKEEVIADQRTFFKRRSATAGTVIAGLFMVPILVCLIVNLASGAGLGWFFIVLAALLVASSVTVVPLMVGEDKGVWTLGSFAASLILLFGVCCLYSGGSWFFIASTAVLFGLSLIFLPFVARSRLFAKIPEESRGILVMAADTALFLLMMLAIGLHVQSSLFFILTASIALPIVALLWGVFFLCRRHLRKKRAEAALAGKPEPRARRRWSTRDIVLLIVGSPIWMPIAISVFAGVFSLYTAIWATVAALWVVFASFAVGVPVAVMVGVIAIARGDGVRGSVMICAGVVLAGLSILMFFACKALTTAVVKMTGKCFEWIRSLIDGRKKG